MGLRLHPRSLVCLCAHHAVYFLGPVRTDFSAAHRRGCKAKTSSFKATPNGAGQTEKPSRKKAKNYKLPLGELAIFTQQLASLLHGRPALGAVARGVAGSNGGRVFAVVIREVRQDISAGNSFSSSGEKIPQELSSFCSSRWSKRARRAARSREILAKVATYFEASVKLSKKVKSAMTYPITVIAWPSCW